MSKNYCKSNWKRVDIEPRDERLIKTIAEEGFVRRDHAIKYIFEGKESYAKIRIRKLKRFGYLKAVSVKAGDPESYLLGPEGIDLVRGFYPIGLRGWGTPSVLESIDPGSYEHSWKVTEVRLLFENLRFCRDWKSERMLRAGTKGGHKVPDGFFTNNGQGIAMEVELSPKKAETYRTIFRVYDKDPKIHYIFYICDTPDLVWKIMKLSHGVTLKTYCFTVLSDFLETREYPPFWLAGGRVLNFKDTFKRYDLEIEPNQIVNRIVIGR